MKIYQWLIIDFGDNYIEKIITDTDKTKADLKAWTHYIHEYTKYSDKVDDVSANNISEFINHKYNYIEYSGYGTVEYARVETEI